MINHRYFSNEVSFDNYYDENNNDNKYQNLSKNIKAENKKEKISDKEIKGKIKTDFISNLNIQPNSNLKIVNTKYEKEINIQIKNVPPHKNKLGRKKKNSNEKGKHTKYCVDNILRRIKSTVISYLQSFLNSSIYKIYKGQIGKGRFIKQLKKMNQKQIVDSSKNKEFLQKNLKDIFSQDISTKFCCFSNDHNRKVIESLLNEEDEEKRVKFEKILTLTFLDCLGHFRGTKNIPELDGMGTFDKISVETFGEDQDYFDNFKYYIYNYEETIMNKKNRKKRQT